MSSRSILQLFHAESDGDALASKTITVTKPDGSALGVSIYDQVSGGAPVLDPQTNSVGTKLLYADYTALDAAAVGRVKVSYSDAPLTTFDDAFWPDPLDLFVDGMTRDRALGGALSVTGLMTGTGGATVSRNADSYAATIQNTHANGKGLHVLAPSGGKSLIRTMRSAGGNDVVALNQINDLVPETTYLLVAKEHASSYVMADFGITVTGAGADSVALRCVASQNTSGNSTYRPLELHTIHDVAAGAAGSAWGIELGVHTADTGDGINNYVGIRLQSAGTGWLAGGSGTAARADTAILILGDTNAGWTHGIRYYDNDGVTVLFNVDQAGAVTAGAITPRTASTYNLGTPAAPWAAVYGGSLIATSNGAANAPSITLVGDTTTGAYLVSAGNLGLTAGGTLRATIGTTISSTVPVLHPAGSAANPSIAGSGNSANSGWFFQADDVIALAVNGGEAFRVTTAGRIDWRNSQNVALGGGAAATLGTIGGSGPAAAAQAGWLAMAVGGTAIYLPYWA